MTDPSPASHSAATGADAAPATELAPPPVAPAPGTASVAPGTASDDPPAAPPAGLWDRMKDDPQYAPEHLALEAVRRLGPQARDWAAHSRAGTPASRRSNSRSRPWRGSSPAPGSPARCPAPPACPAPWSTSACWPGRRPGWCCTSRRPTGRFVPGAAIILGTWANSSATRDLARRAEALYRPAPDATTLPRQRP